MPKTRQVSLRRRLFRIFPWLLVLFFGCALLAVLTNPGSRNAPNAQLALTEPGQLTAIAVASPTPAQAASSPSPVAPTAAPTATATVQPPPPPTSTPALPSTSQANAKRLDNTANLARQAEESISVTASPTANWTPVPPTSTPIPPAQMPTAPPAPTNTFPPPSNTPLPPTSTAAQAVPSFTLATWNIGLDDANIDIIAPQMVTFDGVDIWLLQEVNPAAVAQLEAAIEAGEDADFTAVLGTTGSGQQLLMLFAANRFELLETAELADINTTGNVRSPLVLHLHDKHTGAEFLVMNNHLYRSKEDQRDLQATLLNQWARNQTLPIVAAGDHNFDYRVDDGPLSVDKGYDNMTAGGIWQWIRPAELVTTQCSDSLPCRYDDVLDFVFTAGPAQQWPATSRIVVRDGDFPDDTQKSDHRPVVATFGQDIVDIPAAMPIAAAPPPPTAGPTATVAPTAAPVPVAAGPVVSSSANLRAGPGTEYAIVGAAHEGDALNIAGSTVAGDWYQLADGAWVFAALVANAPDNLPIIGERAIVVGDIIESTLVPEQPAVATPVPVATATPVPPPPTATPEPSRLGGGCDPHYPGVCIPPAPPDLNCGDIQERRFQVLPGDPHNFDRDQDGLGCES